MKRYLVNIIYVPLYVLSLLPFSVLYILSDCIYLFLYRIFGYRKKVVRRNISNSFPHKSNKEQQEIERQFYRFLCDFFVETIKLISMSEKEIKHRMVFKNIEIIDQIVNEGQSCALYLGHYCNWEWVSTLPLWTSCNAFLGQIYHPMENAETDRILLKLRQRMGARCIPMAETIRYIMKCKQEGQPVVIGYISDQVPFWNNIHHWCHFLEQDTPVLTGTERLVKKLDHAVCYLDLRRICRGYYEVEVKLITRTPKKTKEFEITDIYFQMLEETIRRAPAYWLWSHNRWKRSHEEFNIRYDPATGRVSLDPDLEKLKRERGFA